MKVSRPVLNNHIILQKITFQKNATKVLYNGMKVCAGRNHCDLAVQIRETEKGNVYAKDSRFEDEA